MTFAKTVSSIDLYKKINISICFYCEEVEL